MNDLIQIAFKDSESWTTVSGEVINWTDFSKRLAPVRVANIWQKPVLFSTQWNGYLRTVRHTNYNTYSFEMYLRESEILLLQRIQSATEIIITDLVTGIVYNVDLSLPELFEVSDPVKILDTFNYLISVTFRTNKTYVDYGKRNGGIYSFILDNVDDDGDFEAVAQLSEPTWYDLYFEALFSQLDAAIDNTNNNDGYDVPSRILNKANINLLYFTDLTTANFIKKHLPNCNRAFVNENTFTAGTGTVSNLNFEAGTGTVDYTTFDPQILTFSNAQTFDVGYVIRIPGQGDFEITGIISATQYNIDTNIADYNGTFDFSTGIIANALYFSTSQTLRIGQFIKVGTESKRIVGIATGYYLTDSAFATNFEAQTFSISTIYDFLESAIIQIQPVDAELYQVNINATSDIFLHTPENI